MMAFIAQPDSSLSAIQTKVRRLTRNPSEAQLTTTDLNNYINTFVVYDFPEHLRTFNLRTTFTFFTNPYQDEYFTDMAGYGNAVANPSIQNNPLYNFQNNYLSVHPPVYIAGYQALYTQSPEQFFNIYPKINFIQATANSGDGVTTTFTGVINTQQAIVPNSFQQQIALLQRQVLFDSVDSNLNGLTLVDVPVLNTSNGYSTVVGNLYDPNSAAYLAALSNPPTTVLANNNINYATGAYTITFPAAPGANAPINSQTVPQVLALPQAVMYYANKFVVRPVPDQPYRINMEVYQVPTSLLSNSSLPALNEYWQFIAYGASKKIFEDRSDPDSVATILPEYRNQMNLCNRRSIVQYTNERTATIYTEQTAITTGGWTGWGNNT